MAAYRPLLESSFDSTMTRRTPDVHMHEYDDDWKCKCGFRLITHIDPQTGRMNVKAYVTPDGKTVALQEHSGDSSTRRRSKGSAEPEDGLA